MDSDEKTLIQRNLVELVKSIKFSSTFLEHFTQHNIFTEEEVERIESKSSSASKVSVLLNLLPTRVNGFQVLCQALKDSCQTGVLKILGQLEITPANLKQVKLAQTENLEPAKKEHDDKDPTEDIIVADEDCPIPAIIAIIMDNPKGHTLRPVLGNLAIRLLVERSDREEIVKSLEKGDIQLLDAIERVLYLWRVKQGKEAKLSDLLQALYNCKLHDLADDLKKHFVGHIHRPMKDSLVQGLGGTLSETTVEDIIVGDSACPIPQLVAMIEEHPRGNQLQDRLSDLSRRLGFTFFKTRSIYEGFHRGELNLFAALERILYHWSYQCGSRAKLSVLLQALEKCDLQDIAYEIRVKMGNNSHSTPKAGPSSRLTESEAVDNTIADTIVVGDSDCPIPKLVTIIEDHPNGTRLQQKLDSLARKLGISFNEEDILSRLHKGELKLFDAVERVLHLWRAKCGDKARLSVLLEALEKYNYQDIAGYTGPIQNPQ